MERVNWQRIRDILIVVICIGIMVWAAFSIMSIFVHAIVLLLLAMAVAYLVTPLVNILHRYIPRLFASLIVYLHRCFRIDCSLLCACLFTHSASGLLLYSFTPICPEFADYIYCDSGLAGETRYSNLLH